MFINHDYIYEVLEETKKKSTRKKKVKADDQNLYEEYKFRVYKKLFKN